MERKKQTCTGFFFFNTMSTQKTKFQFGYCIYIKKGQYKSQLLFNIEKQKNAI